MQHKDPRTETVVPEPAANQEDTSPPEFYRAVKTQMTATTLAFQWGLQFIH